MDEKLIPRWTNGYIGIPFKWDGEEKDGANCWALVRMVLSEQFGREFDRNSTDLASAQNGGKVEEMMRIYKIGWETVERGLERAGDVVLMSGIYTHEGVTSRADCHVGVVVAPSYMIHVELGTDTVLVNFRTHMSVKRRVVEVLRHEG